jgi:hypothetical protein
MRRSYGKFSNLLAAAAIGLAACCSAHANLVVSVSTVNNTTYTVAGGGAQFLQNLAVTNAGGSMALACNASVTAATHYSSITVGDNGSNSAADRAQGFTDYTATFSVAMPVGHFYRIDIVSRITGAATVVDDYALGNGTNGIASITNVTGSVNGVGLASLNLTSATTQTGSSGTNDVPFNVSNTYTILGIPGSGAAQTYAVRIQFSTVGNSQLNTSVFDNSDEAALRLGIAGSLGSISADDYPGAGSRTIADDGHFLTFTATYDILTCIPEPSSALLALTGLVGLFGFRSRAC